MKKTILLLSISTLAHADQIGALAIDFAPIGNAGNGNDDKTERELWGRAAGRCQFADCNRPLYKSPVTQERVNISQRAHIYSFAKDGPRGRGPFAKKPAGMTIDNLMLVVLNLPLIGMWIKLLTVPYRWLFPAIVLFCAIGVYSTNNNTFDIWLVGAFGVVGYLWAKLGVEPAPLLLGFILGPMMEENLRRALLLSRGDWSVFVTRGLSASLLAVAAVMLIVVLLPSVKSKREEAFVED